MLQHRPGCPAEIRVVTLLDLAAPASQYAEVGHGHRPRRHFSSIRLPAPNHRPASVPLSPATAWQLPDRGSTPRSTSGHLDLPTRGQRQRSFEQVLDLFHLRETALVTQAIGGGNRCWRSAPCARALYRRTYRVGAQHREQIGSTIRHLKAQGYTILLVGQVFTSPWTWPIASPDRPRPGGSYDRRASNRTSTPILSPGV
ncbi:hypothetical protein DSL92_02685 [Billgrantia gudaonensis]|uniref:Uncharacterized protein n=1 Tax=Billgrantia gudaonensis TaxID=376427 RepID=A0A3S0NEF0_9GAMM|nr:hypothetical protein DSL92_02685 [Halomonas gudaonensis]